jgi:hypothetical protein
MLHVRSSRRLSVQVAFLLTVVGFVPQAWAACPRTVDAVAEETLFTFNTLLYAADSVATSAQHAQLQQFLLGYQANAELDAAYPVRLQVAQAVRSFSPELRHQLLAFVLSHPAAVTNYNALVLQLVGAAPSFSPTQQGIPGGVNERHISADRAQLSALLGEVYAAGHVQALWAQASTGWQAQQLCADHLESLRAAIASYVRLPLSPLSSPSKVISNPLMPQGSGVTCVFSDGHFVMLIGPTATAQQQDLLVSHELTHPVLNQLFQHDPRLQVAMANTQCVYDSVLRAAPGNVLTRYVYTTWESYLSETLVRSISHHLTHVPEVAQAAFVVAPRVSVALRAFEASDRSFVDVTLHTLESLRRERCNGDLTLAQLHGRTHPAQHFARQ